jgi:hypothetical protein
MQRSVRSTTNHALEMAIHCANHLQLPLVVVFVIVTSYPGANERGFAFLFEGLSEVQSLLAKRGIRMIVREAMAPPPPPPPPAPPSTAVVVVVREIVCVCVSVLGRGALTIEGGCVGCQGDGGG